MTRIGILMGFSGALESGAVNYYAERKTGSIGMFWYSCTDKTGLCMVPTLFARKTDVEYGCHQGRYQNSVVKTHYLRDHYRAINLMRQWMKIFDGDDFTAPIRRVK